MAKIIRQFDQMGVPFVIGTAASAHQVEGHNVNDWTEFEQEEGNIINGDVSGAATNHYELYDQDFEILNNLGFKAHRMSIEWSRIVPEPGVIDMEEIAHYRDVLGSLRRHDQISFVTLHHFTSPKWFIEKGGFKSPDNLEYWENYVEIICTHLGDMIDVFNTINEPFIYCATAYLSGEHAPGETGIINYLRVGNNLMRAHFIAVDIIRKLCPSTPVGLVKNLINFTAKPGINPINKILRKLIDWGYNTQPLKSLKNRKIPFGIGKLQRGDMGDFIGVNYYVKATIGLGYPDFVLTHDLEEQNLTQMGWGVSPEGLKEEIIRLRKILDLPIFITENGIATDNESWREEYILDHLEVILELLQHNIDIRGYFYWSNIDNFEWTQGYHPKFGLISFDPETYERYPKSSAKMLGNLASSISNCQNLLKFNTK